MTKFIRAWVRSCWPLRLLGLPSLVIEHELISAETTAVELSALEPDEVVARVEAAYESLWG